MSVTDRQFMLFFVLAIIVFSVPYWIFANKKIKEQKENSEVEFWRNSAIFVYAMSFFGIFFGLAHLLERIDTFVEKRKSKKMSHSK